MGGRPKLRKCPHCGETVTVPRLTEATFQIVYHALEAHGWMRQSTADALGMPVRTLRNWIEHYRKLGFDIPDAPDRWAESKQDMRQLEKDWVEKWSR